MLNQPPNWKNSSVIIKVVIGYCLIDAVIHALPLVIALTALVLIASRVIDHLRGR